MMNEGLTVDHLTYLAEIMGKEALIEELTQADDWYALPSCDHASLSAEQGLESFQEWLCGCTGWLVVPSLAGWVVGRERERRPLSIASTPPRRLTAATARMGDHLEPRRWEIREPALSPSPRTPRVSADSRR